MKLLVVARLLTRAYIRAFPSYLVHLFQNESSCRTFHMKTTKLTLQKKDIVYEWFHTKTRLDTEIKSNSEMAFFPFIESPPRTLTLLD